MRVILLKLTSLVTIHIFLAQLSIFQGNRAGGNIQIDEANWTVMPQLFSLTLVKGLKTYIGVIPM